MDILEIIGACIGLLYLALEYRANVWLWPVGIVMSLFYVVIFFHGKFYADAAVYLYYIGANVYGLAAWLRNKDQSDEAAPVRIVHTPKRQILSLVLVSIALWMAIFLVLKNFTDSPVPWGDAFTTSLSVVAMWMLAQKQLEQWLLWVVVNMVSICLYVWKGLYPTAVLFAVYTLVAVLGYLKWKREMLATDALPDNAG
ncbi:MAG: nicotinamide mononucleotide transporter [Bacteroidales bacterium]|nr:nicotinamide mononucleotide transporter [Bacteroidales bacterium]